jgi:hypothetical protein
MPLFSCSMKRKKKKEKNDFVITHPTPLGELGYEYSYVYSCFCRVPLGMPEKISVWRNILNVSINCHSIEYRYYAHRDHPRRIIHCKRCLHKDEQLRKIKDDMVKIWI